MQIFQACDLPGWWSDLRELALWDSSSVAAIDKVVGKFRRNGMEVKVMAPLGAGRELHERLALHDKGIDLDVGDGY